MNSKFITPVILLMLGYFFIPLTAHVAEPRTTSAKDNVGEVKYPNIKFSSNCPNLTREHKMGLIGIKKFRNFDVSHNQVKNKNKSSGFSRFQYNPRISLSTNFFSGFGLPQKSPVSVFLEKTETKRDGETETQKGDHIRVGDGVGFGGSLRLDLFSHVSIRANYNNLLVSFGLKDVEAEGMKQELRHKTNVEELSFELIIRPALSRNSNTHFYFGGGIARMAAKYSLKSNISLPKDSNWLSESFDYKLTPTWAPTMFLGLENIGRTGIFFFEAKFIPAKLRTERLDGTFFGPVEIEGEVYKADFKYTLSYDDLVGPLSEFARTKTDHFKIIMGYSFFLF